MEREKRKFSHKQKKVISPSREKTLRILCSPWIRLHEKKKTTKQKQNRNKTATKQNVNIKYMNGGRKQGEIT